jgi:hypothetical protein
LTTRKIQTSLTSMSKSKKADLRRQDFHLVSITKLQIRKGHLVKEE